MNTTAPARPATRKTYPESSARQALRSQRRAQGGPGITEGKDPQPKTQTVPTFKSEE